jgi:hypothetical protein
MLARCGARCEAARLRSARGKEPDRCTRSALRSVTPCEIRPTVTVSRTRSIKSDDGRRGDRTIGMHVSRHAVENRALKLGGRDAVAPLRGGTRDDRGGSHCGRLGKIEPTWDFRLEIITQLRVARYQRHYSNSEMQYVTQMAATR